MAKNGKKARRSILIIVATLILGGFAFNWYLTHRLESFLRERLSAMIADATDGFYKFSFRKLTVGFFNGELTIEGLELLPDSATFDSWQEKDSLPATYYHANVESIHFEGINLTWQQNYKDLDFSLLKIKKPVIEIFAPDNTTRFRKKAEGKKLKTLYEMISPYIAVLRIKTIALEHSSVSYTVEDSVSPNLYALKNANFKAYYFILDSNSHNSGKLLYCNNFEFSAEEPQILMSNNIFTLKSEKIRLSTQDSLIEVGKTILAPQVDLKTGRKPQSSYVDAQLDKIEIRGINFTRKEAKSYLDAHSFSIEYPAIEYFYPGKKSPTNKGKDIKINPDSIWTLYSMISPILDRVSIDTIKIKSAKMKYISSSEKGNDVYTLNTFNFAAYGFSVDSLSDNQHLFLYSKDFALDATNMQGNVASQNHIFDIGHLSLDTRVGSLNIEKIGLNPITGQTHSDYIKGNIASINLSGIVYNQGVQARKLIINQPNIEYYKGNKNENNGSKKAGSKSLDIASIYPLFNHISITDIIVRDATFSFQNQLTKDRYTLTRGNLYISKLSINEKTLKKSPYLFTYEGFRFYFSNLDNYLSNQTYHLSIEKGSVNTYEKNIWLKDINLSPTQRLSQSEHKQNLIYASSRSINIELSDIGSLLDGENDLKIKTFDIESPKLKFVKAESTKPQTTLNASKPRSMRSILIESSKILDPNFEYIDLASNDSLGITLSAFQVKSVFANTLQEFSVGDITLSDLNFELKNKNEYNVHTSQLKVSNLGLTDESLNIGYFNIFKPSIKLDIVTDNKSEILQSKSHTQQSNNIYTTLGKIRQKISIDDLNINDANINYKLHHDSKSKEQQINAINLKLWGLNLDSAKETFTLDDADCNVRELEFPSRNGFYTYKIGYIDLNKKKAMLQFNDIRMTANYPKMEFAYQHPSHKDWFDISVGEITLAGIEFPVLISDKMLNASYLKVTDFTLQNFKNQKIDIQHNIMPMIYEHLQTLPIKLNIDSADIYNTNIVYEELSKNGSIPGKIFFTNMNGHISGLTNIETRDNKFITINADGKLMGTGNFTATWQIPVNKSHDQFLLNANLHDFDLIELNQLIKPMAPAEITNGILKDVTFSIDASSRGASVDMKFLYNDLKFVILRDAENGTTYRIASQLANKIIKKNNPNKTKSKPRRAQMYVERDAYHSTFNYFWQILQPPLVESVGISEKKQNLLKKAGKFANNIKNVFHPKKKETKNKK